MTFQRNVHIYPAVGTEGAFASMNPPATVAAGPGGLVAGSLGARVGRFVWNAYAVAGGPGVANNFSTGAPAVPAGFIANEQQGLITVWLDKASLIVPPGFPVTEFERGDFWAKNQYGETAIGQKVFANLFTGQVLTAAAGAFPVGDIGSGAAVIASITTASYTMNVGTVSSGGPLEVGTAVAGTGIPFNTFIESFGTGTGTTGTYFLSQPANQTLATGTFTLTGPGGIGGGTMVVDADSGTATATVGTVTGGVVYVGQSISGVGIPAGTYVASLGTSTGGAGTIVLSAATTATITAGVVLFSGFIETPWYAKSAGNVGDLIKIGVKN